jgi:hypothetical protein
MLQKHTAIGLNASIAAALIVLAPMAAIAQVTISPATSQSARSVIRAGSPPETLTLAETAKDKARECSREAAAKELQGKPRKTFLAKCKKRLAAA